MPYKSHRGWYTLKNPSKFIKPIDETMQSTVIEDGKVLLNYKSSLERIAFVYADVNPKIKHFSIEPFPITYLKPTDNKIHRYYIDLFIEFTNGSKFLVEVKSSSETKMPTKPKRCCGKNLLTYKRRLETYMINQSKWKAAKEFAKLKGLTFIILTENELRSTGTY